MLGNILSGAVMIACCISPAWAPRAAAVRAVEQAWTEAELSGNVAYLNTMLLPAYRSIDAHGIVHSKGAILASSLKFKHAPEMAEKVRQRLREQPPAMAVIIEGNTAIVTFYDRALGPDYGTKSCDVFVYSGGSWHALYSQHTMVGSIVRLPRLRSERRKNPVCSGDAIRNRIALVGEKNDA